ncbi:MAG: HNH endonuclease [Luteimonas sp.]|nr:HNH endonuclease [Luteimonas sp.]
MNMVNAVFTASESSAYDDQIEERYHFPNTYLNQVRASLGDYIVYYEPRRTSGPSSATGRQAYFALARLAAVRPDPKSEGHHYAYMSGYIEFDHAVAFRESEKYYESLLQRADGKTNKGAFGRAVRNIPAHEFNAIVQAGFTTQLAPWEAVATNSVSPGDSLHIYDDVPEYVTRPLIEQLVTRKFRDTAFRRHVRNAYNNTCAATGLRLINGGGRPEVQAAHIRPVEHHGPDTVRNGIALTGTAHWLFDRGLLSFDDNYKIILSPHGIPDELDRLVKNGASLLLPEDLAKRPHQTYFRWHRENIFKA